MLLNKLFIPNMLLLCSSLLILYHFVLTFCPHSYLILAIGKYSMYHIDARWHCTSRNTSCLIELWCVSVVMLSPIMMDLNTEKYRRFLFYQAWTTFFSLAKQWMSFLSSKRIRNGSQNKLYDSGCFSLRLRLRLRLRKKNIYIKTYRW